MTELLDISVVIPIYGNNDSLAELNSRLMASLSSFKHEIVYVNDDSPDDSSNSMQILASKHQQIRHIKLLQNVGQQKATLEGLKVVFGKKIVVLDGDLQDTPELIPELYKLIRSEKDAVFVKRKGIYQSIGRMLTSMFIKKIIQIMSGLHYKAGSYYMFDRSLLSDVNLVASKCRYPYVSIIVAQFAHQVKYVTVDRGKGVGPSGYSLMKRIKAAMMAIYCSAYCTYSKLILD